MHNRLQILSLCILSIWLMNRSSVATNPNIWSSDLFENRIRPLLVDRCLECHNAENASGGLLLIDRASLLRGGDHGPAVNLEQPSTSLMLEAVRRTGSLQMPPDHPLSAVQVGWFEQWIQEGAPWPESANLQQVPWDDRKSHWAFQPIQEPSVPAVNQAEWCHNEIDYFILARLERESLHPQGPADRRTLIRRVTMDLLGLLPSYAEVEQFVNDPRPDAYPRLIDRLLASPAYGQQWGRDWLDVARFSDTKGYVYAREERFFAQAPSYRDWVVEALNRDVPYDWFLKLQIAADHYAKEDPAQLPAMGFMTMGRRFLGVTHDIIDDRIDVVSRGTMGLTVSCARCHDHKYDPISTAEYYGLYGVFQNCHEKQVILTSLASDVRAMDSSSPFLVELTKRQQALADQLAKDRREAAERVRERIADYLMAQLRLAQFPEEGFDQLLQPSDLFPSFVRRWEAFLARSKSPGSVMSVWHDFVSISHLAEDAFAVEAEKLCQTYQLGTKTDIHPRLTKAFKTAPRDMQEVANRYQAVVTELRESWSKGTQDSSIENGPPKIVEEADQAWWTLLFGADSPCEVPDESIVTTESYFHTTACENLWKLQGEVDRWLLQSAEAPPVAQLLVDRDIIVPPRILKRGNPANKGSVVPRRFLQAVTDRTVPLENGSGRVQLAEAIVDPRNPLTARVWVNRLWQHHFGTGFVKTASDFGLRAEPPSHPELLDWLSLYLQRHDWSTKQLQRLIVNSAAYQQSAIRRDSKEANELQDKDPENRLLAYQNRHRLRFEEMRDVWLQTTGQLDQRIGGKAEPLFSADHLFRRRSLYGRIDRQFLDSNLRVFDFANPDLHIPKRSETLVPQQALFAMNHPFLGESARQLVRSIGLPATQRAGVEAMFRQTLQRLPIEEELLEAMAFLNDSESNRTLVEPAAATRAWSYGYGSYDEQTLRIAFQPLPHFSGSAWQGSADFPDGKLGWAQLSARGGHPGNDLQHACIRRWTAPCKCTVAIQSLIEHQPEVSDGIRCRIVSNRRGLLHESRVHHESKSLDPLTMEVEEGETIDFVTDILKELHHDEFTWTMTIARRDMTAETDSSTDSTDWVSDRDFLGPVPYHLDPWEQLAQVLLLSNELLFVD